MLIGIDIKKMENHLLILQDELKETMTIIESLKVVYQITDDEKVIQQQLQFMKDEKSCIERKIEILKSSIDKFSGLKVNVTNTLYEAIEILKFCEDF